MSVQTLQLSDQLVQIAIEERLKRRDRWHIAWENGSLTREDWKVWVKQFGFFARTFPRWLANVMSNCPVLEVRQQLIVNMYDEEVCDSLVGDYHYNFLRRMGRSLGLTDDEIDNAAAFSTTVAAINAWNNLTKNRPWPEGLAALTVLELANTNAVREKIGRPKDMGAKDAFASVEMTAEDVRFLSLHQERDEEHGGGESDILNHHAAAPEVFASACDAARDSVKLAYVLWDGIYVGARNLLDVL